MNGHMSARPFIAFTCDEEIAAIGRGVLDLSLPKPRWTHAAHFATALWLIRCRPDLNVSQAMPGFIRAYNQATGVANTDSEGCVADIAAGQVRLAVCLLEPRALVLRRSAARLARARS
jgi:hypothetical protein